MNNIYLTNLEILQLREELYNFLYSNSSTCITGILGIKLHQNLDYLNQLIAIFQQTQEQIFLTFGCQEENGNIVIADEHKDNVKAKLQALYELPILMNNMIYVSLDDIGDIKLSLQDINLLYNFIMPNNNMSVPEEIMNFDSSFIYQDPSAKDIYYDKDEHMCYYGTDAIEKMKENIWNNDNSHGEEYESTE